MLISYKTIGGSRAYGLEIPGSDIDVLCIADVVTKTLYRDGPYNFIQIPAEDFIHRPVGVIGVHDYLQWLFPHSFELENTLTAYIRDQRERIIMAQLPNLLELYSHAAALKEYADKIYRSYPKRMAYSTLFYSILANYAEGMSFAQAHRPEGELHDFLIGMRLGQVPLADAVARNELERLRAEKAAGFYKEAVHPELLKEFEQVILDQAGKER